MGPGDVLATYTLVAELGKTAGGAVQTFAAHAEGGDKPELVLVEVLRAGKGVDLGGFARRARSLEAIQHASIPRTREVRVEAGFVLVVSDFFDGESLRDLDVTAPAGRDRALPMIVRLRVLVDVLAALAAMHAGAAPILHGEVAPANVLVGMDGTTRLVRAHHAPKRAMRDVASMLGYLAPELLLGDDTADTRADLYAIGVMLWESLSAERLFTESTHDAVLQRQLARDLPRARVAEPAGWAVPLVDVAARATAVDPGARYGSAAELAGAIRLVAQARLAPPKRVATAVDLLAGDRILARRMKLRPAQRAIERVPTTALDPEKPRDEARTAPAEIELADILETHAEPAPLAAKASAPPVKSANASAPPVKAPATSATSEAPGAKAGGANDGAARAKAAAAAGTARAPSGSAAPASPPVATESRPIAPARLDQAVATSAKAAIGVSTKEVASAAAARDSAKAPGAPPRATGSALAAARANAATATAPSAPPASESAGIATAVMPVAVRTSMTSAARAGSGAPPPAPIAAASPIGALATSPPPARANGAAPIAAANAVEALGAPEPRGASSGPADALPPATPRDQALLTPRAQLLLSSTGTSLANEVSTSAPAPRSKRVGVVIAALVFSAAILAVAVVRVAVRGPSEPASIDARGGPRAAATATNGSAAATIGSAPSPAASEATASSPSATAATGAADAPAATAGTQPPDAPKADSPDAPAAAEPEAAATNTDRAPASAVLRVPPIAKGSGATPSGASTGERRPAAGDRPARPAPRPRSTYEPMGI